MKKNQIWGKRRQKEKYKNEWSDKWKILIVIERIRWKWKKAKRGSDIWENETIKIRKKNGWSDMIEWDNENDRERKKDDVTEENENERGRKNNNVTYEIMKTMRNNGI